MNSTTQHRRPAFVAIAVSAGLAASLVGSVRAFELPFGAAVPLPGVSDARAVVGARLATTAGRFWVQDRNNALGAPPPWRVHPIASECVRCRRLHRHRLSAGDCRQRSWRGCSPAARRRLLRHQCRRDRDHRLDCEVEVSIGQVGSGFVGSNPAGIDCGTNCLTDFAQGATVELFAAAASGWRFSHFSGDCSGSGTCLVDMNADRQVTASFIEQFALSVLIDGQGSVISDPSGIDCGADCSAVYDRDTDVTLTAAPGPGWVLAQWIGAACPLAATCTISMQQPRTVTARFETAGDLLYRDGFE